MWIDGKFVSEPELQAHIKQAKVDAFREGYLKAVDTMAQETAKEMSELEAERDAYKRELILWLGKIGECDVPLAFPAHLRLEELIGRPHVNICEGDWYEV
jgi:hypothetical protein